MIQPLSIPVVTTLKTEDATAIRQIVSTLIQSIDSLRRDVEALKTSVAQQQKSSYNKFGARR
jgi:hypothetical protein